MKITIRKWGNSVAVRIPAAILAAAHIGLDQVVEVREEHGRIVIEPVRRKVYKLDVLLGGITSKNQHQLVATGASIGKEIW
jgi:antitoxin MazE